jgi:hypothetical protein
MRTEYARIVTETNTRAIRAAKNKAGAPRAPAINLVRLRTLYELAFSTVTARRFCDQQEMSLQTATGRSLP